MEYIAKGIAFWRILADIVALLLIPTIGMISFFLGNTIFQLLRIKIRDE